MRHLKIICCMNNTSIPHQWAIEKIYKGKSVSACGFIKYNELFDGHFAKGIYFKYWTCLTLISLLFQLFSIKRCPGPVINCHKQVGNE